MLYYNQKEGRHLKEKEIIKMMILVAVAVLVSVVLNGYMLGVMFGDFARWIRNKF